MRNPFVLFPILLLGACAKGWAGATYPVVQTGSCFAFTAGAIINDVAAQWSAKPGAPPQVDYDFLVCGDFNVPGLPCEIQVQVDAWTTYAQSAVVSLATNPLRGGWSAPPPAACP